jgi:hypothetical protein
MWHPAAFCAACLFEEHEIIEEGSTMAHSKISGTAIAAQYPFLLSTPLLIGVFVLFPSIISNFDSQYYLSIAAGHIQSEHTPFTSRALIPLLAGALSRYASVSLEQGFMLIAAISNIAFAWAVKNIARSDRFAATPSLIYTVLSFFSVQTFAVAVMPDAASAALIACSLAALKEERFALGAVAAAAAVAVRESNIIFLVFVLWYFGTARQWKLLLLTVILGGAAYRLTQYFASEGSPNIHEMNGALYMAMKIPVNFLSQVMGIPLWTDSMAWCSPPVFVYKLPSFLPTGKVHEIGMCGWSPVIPLKNLATLLTVFGILPSLLLVARGGKYNRWIMLTGGYGALMVVLGFCSGWSVARLVTYGWPLYVLTLPLLWQRQFGRDLPLKLLPLHLAALVICVAFKLPEQPLGVPLELLAVGAATACQVGALVIASRALKQPYSESQFRA